MNVPVREELCPGPISVDQYQPNIVAEMATLLYVDYKPACEEARSLNVYCDHIRDDQTEPRTVFYMSSCNIFFSIKTWEAGWNVVVTG